VPLYGPQASFALTYRGEKYLASSAWQVAVMMRPQPLSSAMRTALL